MAVTCPWCHSDETQTLADRWQCLHCQKTFAEDGTKYVGPGPRGVGEISPHPES
jgi:ribosomal protein L37AE/L43A